MGWVDWFCGAETIRLSARERRYCTALMMREGIAAVKTENTGDGALCVTLRCRDAARLRAVMATHGFMLPQREQLQGLPCLLAFWRRRPGLPIGALLAFCIWMLSTLFIWRVDVVCLDNAQGTAVRDHLDVAQVREQLDEFGITQGMFWPSMDVRRLENRFLIGQEDISWIAINRRGTVLSVEVRPAHPSTDDLEPELTVGEDGYWYGTHLVADADGKILSFSVRGGQPVVQPEQIVLRGELLASGIYTSETGDSVGGRAQGEVMAETVRIIESSIPLTVASVQTTGVIRTEYTVSLFGREVMRVSDPRAQIGEIVTFLETFFKIGEKGGIDGESCGIITNEAISDAGEWSLCLPDGMPLPLSVRKTIVTGVMECPVTLTEQQALQEARIALDAEEEALGAARILSREEAVSWEEDCLTVTRYVYCVDNIAVRQEFKIKAEP